MLTENCVCRINQEQDKHMFKHNANDDRSDDDPEKEENPKKEESANKNNCTTTNKTSRETVVDNDKENQDKNKKMPEMNEDVPVQSKHGKRKDKPPHLSQGGPHDKNS